MNESVQPRTNSCTDSHQSPLKCFNINMLQISTKRTNCSYRFKKPLLFELVHAPLYKGAVLIQFGAGVSDVDFVKMEATKGEAECGQAERK
jgi:hypothetical protein